LLLTLVVKLGRLPAIHFESVGGWPERGYERVHVLANVFVSQLAENLLTCAGTGRHTHCENRNRDETHWQIPPSNHLRGLTLWYESVAQSRVGAATQPGFSGTTAKDGE
jgi:hypothetical protein